MNTISPVRKALGKQWKQLPKALQSHHQSSNHSETGYLNVEYPLYLQPYFSLMHLFGALINRRGNNIPTTVKKHMQGDIQYWDRFILLPNHKAIRFKSYWQYINENEFIEYVNNFIGLRMAVHVENNMLCYEGRHFVIRIGKLIIPIAEWLVLGHTTIIENAVSENEIEMDFKLTHPLLGVIYRYSGKFICLKKLN